MSRGAAVPFSLSSPLVRAARIAADTSAQDPNLTQRDSVRQLGQLQGNRDGTMTL
jgi:hypothetical protein